jgi:hypothetical protein
MQLTGPAKEAVASARVRATRVPNLTLDLHLRGVHLHELRGDRGEHRFVARRQGFLWLACWTVLTKTHPTMFQMRLLAEEELAAINKNSDETGVTSSAPEASSPVALSAEHLCA